jgi:hypothetical protein
VDTRTGLNDLKKILHPSRTRTPNPQSSSPWSVAIPTTLFRNGRTALNYGEKVYRKAIYTELLVRLLLNSCAEKFLLRLATGWTEEGSELESR